MALSKALKNYQAAISRLFNSPDGHAVLAVWREDFVNKQALVPGDSMSTGYLLGQKELVQGFIKHLKDEDVLDDVKLEIE